MKTSSNPIPRAVLGILSLIVIVVVANWIMQLTSVGKQGVDFTQHKVHTLQDGTKAILAELDAPVNVRYYATQKSESMPRDLKLYMRTVKSVLRRYAALSDGKLRIEMLDPQPDTDAEDSAIVDGVQGQRVQDGSYEENIFHGVVISCLDKAVTIPFLYPSEETNLEYELSRSIAEVSRIKKPTLGVMSALPISGGPPQMPMPGQRPPQAWVAYQQLQKTFTIEDLGMTPEALDPEKLTALLLIHPAGITPEVEFLIDQYVLKGGTVVACLDSFSFAAEQTGGPPNPMTGRQQPGVPTSSTLPTLLEGWGIKYSGAEVVADRKYATPLQDGRVAVGLLNLPEESMPQRKDDLITQGINDLYFIFTGGFTVTGGKGAASTTLVQSSRDTALVNSFQASRMDQSLLTSMRPEGKAYDLAVHLSGNFSTSFPEGDPSAAPKEEAGTEPEPAGEESSEATVASEEDQSPEALKKATKPGNVFLIADSDFISDQFAYRPIRMGNSMMYSALNGNSSLLFNILDQATGSSHLIGSRSRASTRRPFTLVQEMEARSERKTGEEKAKLEKDLEEANQKLGALQAQLPEGTNVMLNPEVQTEIKQFQLLSNNIDKKIRNLEKDLKRDKDQLSSHVMRLNLLVVPLLVALICIVVQTRRRLVAAAR
jgi:ABC-type uncharacterized transport system involved in gliding motility auxiliary subunit